VSTVSYDIHMSLDGYVRARNPTPDAPLGQGGDVLHEYAFDGSDPAGLEQMERSVGRLGAVICGRRTYDDSLRWWGPDGPTGEKFRLPLVVVTHREPADVPADSVYHFATGGIEDALARARELAGGKPISLMGGPDLATQFVAAGLVDEISIHVVPYLFGGGTTLLGALPAHVALEPVDQVSTRGATHLRYRVTSTSTS
jgi:dihydrofolate reductase